LQPGEGVAGLAGCITLRTAARGGEPVMCESVGTIASRLERAGEVQLRRGVLWTGGRGVLIISEGMWEVTGRETIASFTGCLVHHSVIARARRKRSRRAAGVLGLQRFDLLFVLIELRLLLGDLILKRLELIPKTSGAATYSDQHAGAEPETGRPLPYG
jgi:hypothetical protein